MKKNAIYPGTFDPITFGHIDVIKKALKFVDTIIVAISDGDSKNYLFSASERLEIILTEIRDIMEMRKQRVEQLREQIAFIENENKDLERKINELIQDAF